MTKELENNKKLKAKIAEIGTVLSEVQELVDFDESDNRSIQKSIDFISTSLIDLNYKIYDHNQD